jgi:REP-associated tyrosine transposase
VQFIKGRYSHEIRNQFGGYKEIWQRGFTDHRIRDEADFERHRQYILKNPIRRKLVLQACEYRYCSAFPGYKLDAWPSAAEAKLVMND